MARKYSYQKKVTQEIKDQYSKRGAPLRCYLCGRTFEIGELMSWVFCNSYCVKRGGFHNFMVCESCDGDDVIERWAEHCKTAEQKFWWLFLIGDNDE